MPSTKLFGIETTFSSSLPFSANISPVPRASPFLLINSTAQVPAADRPIRILRCLLHWQSILALDDNLISVTVIRPRWGWMDDRSNSTCLCCCRNSLEPRTRSPLFGTKPPVERSLRCDACTPIRGDTGSNNQIPFKRPYKTGQLKLLRNISDYR
ncbi:hypothetical protein H4582DRAFT_1936173 [Lactarius indigo]|nr:hypothetical protein H4582DRAFT_1936173 [Lactarius indigo]